MEGHGPNSYQHRGLTLPSCQPLHYAHSLWLLPGQESCSGGGFHIPGNVSQDAKLRKLALGNEHWNLAVFVVWLLSCNPMDCSPPGSSVHWVFQGRILEWVAIPFSRGFSQPRDQTRVSCWQMDSLPPGHRGSLGKGTKLTSQPANEGLKGRFQLQVGVTQTTGLGVLVTLHPRPWGWRAVVFGSRCWIPCGCVIRTMELPCVVIMSLTSACLPTA